MHRRSSSTYQTQNIPWQAKLQGASLAEFRPRATAYAIDLTLVGIVLVIAEALIRTPTLEDGNKISFSFEIGGLLSFGIFVAYFALATYFGRGRTPSKRTMGIMVISVVHEHLSLWHCTERALGYAASSLEAGFGFLQFFIHPNRQTVHDRIAETIVVTTKKRREES